MKRITGLAVLVVGGLAATACGTNSTNVVYVNGDGGDNDGGVLESGSGSPALTPKQECERYLACVNEAMPAQGGAAVALYGDGSPCWKGSAADAKNCGEACRLSRTTTTRGGSRYPSCGCSADSECDVFCAKEGVCVSPEWNKILDACTSFANDVKADIAARKKALPSYFSAGECLSVDGAKCDAIRDLRFQGASAEDSSGTSVYSGALHDLYACSRASDQWGRLGTFAPPSGAPSSCQQMARWTRPSCKGSADSADLDLIIVP